MIYDFCIIGGGIVGLATARAISMNKPNAKILLLEKESAVGLHQTSHNSGVIHAGIYYAPGSLKANLCRNGLLETKRYCAEKGIRFDECGKLIVAANELEVARIEALYDRANSNGLKLEKLTKNQTSSIEPNIRAAASLLSPETAIVNFAEIAKSLAADLRDKCTKINLKHEIIAIEETDAQVTIFASNGDRYRAMQLIVCGGLQSDRLARMAGIEIDFKIVPFRGEYFQLPPEKNRIVKHLIYPAPDPTLPFLGVHLTRMIDGSVTVGPNAILGFSREGYPKWSFDMNDALSFLSYPGFWKFLYKHRAHVLHEMKTSISKKSYLRDCQKYCPSLKMSDLLPYRSGIRAQAVSDDGEMIHDFIFKETKRSVHVCNAPSPAATSSLPIGKLIAEKVALK